MQELTLEQVGQPLSDAERDEALRVLAELRTLREEMARESGVEFLPDSTPMIRAMREGDEDELAAGAGGMTHHERSSG